MREFLRRHWPYVVLPALVVVAVVLWLLSTSGGADGPTHYPL